MQSKFLSQADANRFHLLAPSTLRAPAQLVLAARPPSWLAMVRTRRMLALTTTCLRLRSADFANTPPKVRLHHRGGLFDSLVRLLVTRCVKFIMALVSLAPPTTFAQSQVNIKIGADVMAKAEIQDEKLLIAHSTAGGLHQSFGLQLPGAANINVRLINQDSFPDIEVWHTDEGMGTYTIHYLFIYSNACKAFFQLTPKHSEVFVNLHVGRPGEALRYSGREIRKNRWRQYSQTPNHSAELTNCSKPQSAAHLEH
jgi:hypothetical protein